MQTTNHLTNALQSLFDALLKSDNLELTEDMLTAFRELASENPCLYPLLLNALPSSQDTASVFANIEQHASASFTMPYLPVSYFKDNIQSKIVYTPAFLPWQKADNKVKNVIINYNSSTA